MGRDHRRDQSAPQQLGDRVLTGPFGAQGAQGAGQGVRAGVAAATATAVDLVLGDVGDLQEAGEGVDEADRVGEAQAGQPLGHAGRGLGRALPVEGDRGLADLLDLVEHSLAVLGADHIAQHAAHEADSGPELVGERLAHGRKKPRSRGSVSPYSVLSAAAGRLDNAWKAASRPPMAASAAAPANRAPTPAQSTLQWILKTLTTTGQAAA